MKIISYNVNGLRSSLKNGLIQKIEAMDADIICLQETKMNSGIIDGLNGYHQYFNYASRKGYSGTAILSRAEPINVANGVDSLSEDEGRVITAEYEKYYLVCVYVPSIGSGREEYRMAFDAAFRKYISRLICLKPVIVCGDFNCAYQYEDVYSPTDYYETPGFTVMERNNFGKLLSTGLLDSLRVLQSELQNVYTWWSYRGNCRVRNVGMRLDYCLISNALAPYLESSRTLPNVTGSDHCPIEIIIRTEEILDSEGNNIIAFPIQPETRLENGTFSSFVNSYDEEPSNVDAHKSVSEITQIPAATKSKSLLSVTCARFKKYDFTFEDENGIRITRRFIVLERDDHDFRFTDFHRYIRNPRKKTNHISQHGQSRFDFIVPFLNHIYFVQGIRRLDELSVEMIQTYITFYATSSKNNVTRGTVERCMDYIFDFVELLLEDKRNALSFKLADLYKVVPKRDKKGKIYKIKVPVFNIPVKDKVKAPLNRDIPQKVFFLLLELIVQQHTDLLGMVMICAFAGARASEGCNVRCPNSPLGPGIIFTRVNGQIVKVQIDLTREIILRSDGVDVGRIKKERTQIVPQLFLKAFVTCYDIYESYMATVKKGRDPEFMPFSINSHGKTMTYDCFYQRFKAVVQDLIEICLKSEDPEIAMYGHILIDHPITPHIFRHYYTVQLVLSGISEPGELMSLRGDNSPESAMAYLQNKGELEKQFTLVNDKTFDYLSWVAEKKYKVDKHG